MNNVVKTFSNDRLVNNGVHVFLKNRSVNITVNTFPIISPVNSGGARGVMVIVVGKGHNGTRSNPRRD